MIWALLLCGTVQDGHGFRIEPKVEVRPTPQGDSFRLFGTSTLPQGAVVRVDLFRAGTGEGRQIFSKALRIRDGTFEAEAHIFPGETPPGQWLLRVTFDLTYQDRAEVIESVRKAGLEGHVTATAPLVVGTREKFNRMRLEYAQSLADELNDVLGALDAAIAESQRDGKREAILGSRKRVHQACEAREKLRALDYHYGFVAVVSESVEPAIRHALEALDLLAGNCEGAESSFIARASALRQDCSHAVAAGITKLSLFAETSQKLGPGSSRLSEVVESTMEDWVAARDREISWDSFRRSLTGRKQQIENLLLEFAQEVEKAQYALVVEIGRKVGEYFALLESDEQSENSIQSSWNALKSDIKALSGH